MTKLIDERQTVASFYLQTSVAMFGAENKELISMECAGLTYLVL
jgi:hypothetical protein